MHYLMYGMRYTVCGMRQERSLIYGMLCEFQSFCSRSPSESMPPCQSLSQRGRLEIEYNDLIMITLAYKSIRKKKMRKRKHLLLLGSRFSVHGSAAHGMGACVECDLHVDCRWRRQVHENAGPMTSGSGFPGPVTSFSGFPHANSHSHAARIATCSN